MADFVLQITGWYRLNARQLPWRATKNAYFIWLSEVILQQTRVDQGMTYYLRFTEHFPTVEALANADEEQVLKLWQGLGYYARARNLHKTAKEVVERFGGKFPETYDELLSLKGVGPYTAAAIASFAFGLQYAVVDGNVYRILSRYYGIDTPIDATTGKKQFQELATGLIPENDPALFNQAIMEFAALHCTPANPGCDDCVLLASCASGRSGLWKQRPLKSKKTAVRDRFFHYFHLETESGIAVRKREGKDVWQQLYEFPLIETTDAALTADDLLQLRLSPAQIEKVFEAKHVLSHQRIFASFYKVQTPDLSGFFVADAEAFHMLPIHRLMHKYVERFM